MQTEVPQLYDVVRYFDTYPDGTIAKNLSLNEARDMQKVYEEKNKHRHLVTIEIRPSKSSTL